MQVIVGFSKSKKKFALFSQAIRLIEGTPYSHVYFQFKSPKHNLDFIYQASSTMLNYMSKDVFLLHNEVVDEFVIDLTPDQYNKLMNRCMRSAGLPYGKKQIVGIVLALIFRLDHNPLSNENEYHCSEWVAEELEELGYKFNKPLDLVTPLDINKKLTDEIKNKRSKATVG